MRILITLSYDVNYDLRSYYEAKSLIKHGHNVTILVWDKNGENPIREVKEGINVARIRNTRFMDFIPYDIFRSYFFCREGYKTALKLHKERPFNVIHCHDLITLPIGVKLKKKYGIPLIYDAREIWGYMVAKDLPRWWSNCYLWKEKYCIKYVDDIVTVNEPLKKYFSKITRKPITIVMNCKQLRLTEYKPIDNKKFTLIYIGTLTKPRFLLELVDVVKELKGVYCIIAGGGKPQYVDDLKNKCSKLQNVDFVGKIPMEEVLPMTGKADVVMCMINPQDLNNRRALANKQFEAMACGRPIIITKDTYAGELTKKLNCGLVIDFDKEALKEAIIKLRDNPELCEKLGKNALKAAIGEYNWEKQEEKLLEIYENLKK